MPPLKCRLPLRLFHLVLGLEFSSLLDDRYSSRFYGISKSPAVPATAFPIQFVDAANVTAAPVIVKGAGGNSYLYPLDQVLRPPVGKIVGWSYFFLSAGGGGVLNHWDPHS